MKIRAFGIFDGVKTTTRDALARHAEVSKPQLLDETAYREMRNIVVGQWPAVREEVMDEKSMPGIPRFIYEFGLAFAMLIIYRQHKRSLKAKLN